MLKIRIIQGILVIFFFLIDRVFTYEEELNVTYLQSEMVFDFDAAQEYMVAHFKYNIDTIKINLLPNEVKHLHKNQKIKIYQYNGYFTGYNYGYKIN